VRKWVGRIVGILFAVVILALLVYGYLPKPMDVEVAAVSKGPLRVSVEEEGKARVRERYTVQAPIAGVAERIELDPGAPVEEGTVLARIRPMRSPLLDPQSRAGAEAALRGAEDGRRQAEAAVARAGTASKLGHTELERAEKLAGAGALAARDLDRARAEARLHDADLASARFALRLAAHEVERARAALGAFEGRRGAAVELTSPVKGRVLRVLHESEGAVTPLTPLVEVGDPASLEIVVEVLTREAVDLQPGMRAVVEHWGGDRPLLGRVRTVEPSAFTRVSPLGIEEQRVNVLVDLEDEQAAQQIGDGYSVDVAFVLWEGTGVLQAPASAVFRRGDGWAAFVARDGRARLTEV